MAVRRRGAGDGDGATGPLRARSSRAQARYFARMAGVVDADELSADELRRVAAELESDPTRATAAAMMLGALDAADEGRTYRPYSERRRSPSP